MADHRVQYLFAGHDHVFAHSILQKPVHGKSPLYATINQFVTPNSAGGSTFTRPFVSLSATAPGDWTAALYGSGSSFNTTVDQDGFLLVTAAANGVDVTMYCHNITADTYFRPYSVTLPDAPGQRPGGAGNGNEPQE